MEASYHHPSASSSFFRRLRDPFFGQRFKNIGRFVPNDVFAFSSASRRRCSQCGPSNSGGQSHPTCLFVHGHMSTFQKQLLSGAYSRQADPQQQKHVCTYWKFSLAELSSGSILEPVKSSEHRLKINKKRMYEITMNLSSTIFVSIEGQQNEYPYVPSICAK